METLAHELESLFIQLDRGEASRSTGTRASMSYDTLDEIEDRVAAPSAPALVKPPRNCRRSGSRAAGEAEPAAGPAPGDASRSMSHNLVSRIRCRTADPATPDRPTCRNRSRTVFASMPKTSTAC